jgi:nicotinate-nucleotide adenylyltransferase
MARSGDREGVGVLGGTFDPIHFGHLRMAEEVRESFGLSRVLFIPAGSPPHKDPEGITSIDHRLRMAKAAVKQNPFFEVWEVEKERERSYSVETLKELNIRFGQLWDLYFILGLDAFLEIHTWHEYKTLFELSHWVVLRRPGSRSWGARALPRYIEGLFQHDPATDSFVHKSGKRVFFRHFRTLEISASEIRALVRAGRSIRYLVPTEVEDYINQHHLYHKEGAERI